MLEKIITPHWLHPRFRYQNVRIIHSIRLAVAMLISQMVANKVGGQHGVWITVTVAVVLASLPHTGSVLEKSRQRLLGTAMGALTGFILLYLTEWHPGVSWLAMLLVFGLTGYWAVGKNGYIPLIGCVTTAIILGSHTMEIGLWRTMNVFLGITLAIAFSQLFPERARDHWFFLLEESVEQLIWLYRELTERQTWQSTLDDELRARQGKMRELLAACARESGIAPASLRQVLSQLHRAQISIEFMASETGQADRQTSEPQMTHANIVGEFQQLAAWFGLPMSSASSSNAQSQSQKQTWLCDALQRHLVALNTQLAEILPKLKSQALT